LSLKRLYRASTRVSQTKFTHPYMWHGTCRLPSHRQSMAPHHKTSPPHHKTSLLRTAIAQGAMPLLGPAGVTPQLPDSACLRTCCGRHILPPDCDFCRASWAGKMDGTSWAGKMDGAPGGLEGRHIPAHSSASTHAYSVLNTPLEVSRHAFSLCFSHCFHSSAFPSYPHLQDPRVACLSPACAMLGCTGQQAGGRICPC